MTAQPAQFDLTAHCIVLAGETDFAGWRAAARRLALAGVPPHDVSWGVLNDESSATSPLPSPHSP